MDPSHLAVLNREISTKLITIWKDNRQKMDICSVTLEVF